MNLSHHRLWRTQSIDVCISLNTLNDENTVIEKEESNCQTSAVAESVMLDSLLYLFSSEILVSIYIADFFDHRLLIS